MPKPFRGRAAYGHVTVDVRAQKIPRFPCRRCHRRHDRRHRHRAAATITAVVNGCATERSHRFLFRPTRGHQSEATVAAGLLERGRPTPASGFSSVRNGHTVNFQAHRRRPSPRRSPVAVATFRPTSALRRAAGHAGGKFKRNEREKRRNLLHFFSSKHYRIWN